MAADPEKVEGQADEPALPPGISYIQVHWNIPLKKNTTMENDWARSSRTIFYLNILPAPISNNGHVKRCGRIFCRRARSLRARATLSVSNATADPVFGERLRLDGEQSADEEEQAEIVAKYARRGLDTNAYRYEEPEVDENEDAEPEPEVDLSDFLARQRLDNSSSLVHPRQHDDDDDVDYTLAAVTSAPSSAPVKPRKNQVHNVEWDASLDELKREKESAEAVWDLKTRFRQAQPRLTAPKSTPGRETRKSDKVEDARHVSKPPDADGHVSKPLDAEPVPKPTSKTELEDFLDDLLG
ncbi:hypothetical protein M422DRAFT_249056 [Sphaerobolus stellatus SS14]|nr:hypothetical protein M422DRAFT_249056 [Sphaerobolus stellatus SS14]